MDKGGLYLALGDSTVWNNYEAGAEGSDIYPWKLYNYMKSNYGNIKFLNKGIGGQTSTEMVSNLWWNSNIKADLVTIGIGMNDCVNDVVGTTNFSNNLNTIIDKLRKLNKNVIIILCAPNTTSDSTRTPYIASYRTAMSNVAAAKNVGYCDFSTAFSNTATYTTDNIHPNKAGHALIYNILQPIVLNSASTWLNNLNSHLV